MTIHKLPTSIDLSKSILWQYEHAPRIRQVIQMIQDVAEESSVELWKKAFFAFDLDRPIKESDADYEFRAHGLSALSILFGIERPTINIEGHPVFVDINTWRLYVKGMIWIMDSDGSCEDINRWLSIVFPDLTAYVEDGLDMTIKYRFYPTPEEGSVEYQLINIKGFMPHPAGVFVKTEYSPVDIVFGFEGQDLGQLNESRLSEIDEF